MDERDLPKSKKTTPDREPDQGAPVPPPLPSDASPLFQPSAVPPTLPDAAFDPVVEKAPPRLDENAVDIDVSRKKRKVLPELDLFFNQNNLRTPPIAGRVRVVPPVRKEEDAEASQATRLRKLFFSRFSISGIVSLFVHFLLFFLLMLIVWQITDGSRGIAIIGGTVDVPLSVQEIEKSFAVEMSDPHSVPTESDIAPSPQISVTQHHTDQTNRADDEIINTQFLLRDLGDLAAGLEKTSGGGFASRTAAQKSRLLSQGSISQAGENAIDAGLQWLVAHQFPDGGWDFRLHNNDFHQLSGLSAPCPGLCTAPGTHPSRNAATALALLAFLGAGYTHVSDNPYRFNIERGLTFLKYNAENTEHGKNFRENDDKGMYAQGMAVMALCEVYAMTGDASFKEDAQRGLDYITWAQNTETGGWRYVPYSLGGGSDTTVTGWQYMALKSGKMAGLNVSSVSMDSVGYFLDQVITPGTAGSEYSYMSDHAPRTYESHRATTAIGLLLRMYLGWTPGNSTLVKGIHMIYQWGPSYGWTNNQEFRGARGCPYYDFYATILLHHYGGHEWERFYPDIYQYLIQHQSKVGHESGSWHFPDPNCDVGGRLLNTCLAIMILEVPYRYMPLYRNLE